MKMEEKNTKYFFNLERSNAKMKTMTVLVNQKGETVRQAQAILKEQKQFYQDLYTSNLTVHFEMNIPPEKKLSEEQVNQIDGELTLEELGIALKQTKCFKSPGPDGIPADWLKVFYIKIKNHLLNAFNYAFKGRKITHIS